MLPSNLSVDQIFIPRAYFGLFIFLLPVTVVERSDACTVFARSEAGIVGSNRTQGMDVWYVYCLFCVVLSCV
jgi:hypothetical protein